MQWGIIYTIWCIVGCYHVTVRGEYIGCYERTSDLYESVGDVQSTDACKRACSTRDKTYYVIKSKGSGGKIECHCADRLPGASTDSHGCSSYCSEECGGPQSRSIYSVCNHGYWGWSCEYACFCEGYDRCLKNDGLCPAGCQPGYWGPQCVHPCHCGEACRQSDGHCDTPCPPGYWGVVCSDKCHCSDDGSCNKDAGHCPQGCDVGIDHCQIGRWGDQCTQTCHCKHGEACRRDNGSCPSGCSPGWKGEACNISCVEGFWGANCSKQCHCINGNHCGKTNGYCEDGCDGSYMGFSCEDDTCDPGFWGLACNNTCHCENKADCMRTNGLCPDGCEPGKYGPSCDKEASYKNIGCFSSEILQESIAEDIQDNRDKEEGCRQMCISHKTGYFTVVTDTDINEKCHCIKNSPYNYRQECPSANLLRKLLAIDDFIIIYTVCPTGSYSTNGNDCNQYCSCPGDSNQSGLCVYDSDSGTEVCEECTGGWQGELCAQDVNECDLDHGCEGDCVNVPGSYHCTCPDGTQLAADYRKCVNITTGPSFCAPGFRYSADSERCVDIDECTEDTHGCSYDCRNTQGSFQCLCPDGRAQVSCVDIPQTEQPNPDSKKGLGTTAIIIIAVVVGALVILAVIVTAVILVRKRQSKPSHPDDLKSTKSKPSAMNIYNNAYDTVGEKVEGVYHTIPDPDDKRPTSDVILMENTNYESRETHAYPDGKRPTSDVILMENSNYESQETHADTDNKRPTSEVIILDNTNYESHDLINDTKESENAYHLAKENDTNDDMVSGDSRTVVVNGDVYNLPNKPQNIDLKEDGKLLTVDSKTTDIDKSMYSLATEGVGAGDGKGAYSLAQHPEDPGVIGCAYSLAKNHENPYISEGAYSLAKNPDDNGVSGVFNLATNPDNSDVNDVNEETSTRMNESEKIVNGDIYKLPANKRSSATMRITLLS